MTRTKNKIWRTIIFFLIVLLTGLLVLSMNSCGGTKKKTKEKTTSEYNDKTNPQYLQYEDIKIGKGREAKKGDKIAMYYSGYLFNGKKFDSATKKEGRDPFEFTLGNDEVIKGWDKGILGMKVGGERILIVPSELAYGAAGSGENIPPNSPLRFEVKLIKFVKDKKSKK